MSIEQLSDKCDLILVNVSYNNAIAFASCSVVRLVIFLRINLEFLSTIESLEKGIYTLLLTKLEYPFGEEGPALVGRLVLVKYC